MANLISKKMKMVDAKSLAQRIAFAPLTFQAVRAMLEFGLIKIIDDATGGLTLQEIEAKCPQTHYTISTLLEVGLFTDIFELEDGRYKTTKIAQCFLYDTMTKVNMNFVQDVCYQGGFYLKESFENAKPQGLKVFGNWPTVYEGLSSLPEKVKESWFAFDHFYSDNAFVDVIKIILAKNPKSVFDIGCNTGKFEKAFFASGYSGVLTLIDLPQQLAVAKENMIKNGYEAKCIFYPADVLKAQTKLPPNPDAVLMSQFLDCFSAAQIVSIIKKAASVMGPNSRLYILEPFWDKQRFEAAKLSLTHTSLYFTAIANGVSKMYCSAEMTSFVEAGGLKVIKTHDNIGAHEYTLLECAK
ncbi:MAG: methyltransferase domain-containing protein [Elusimicrobiota bacterium]|jgi:SAM-dependent methyltransferase|nr:methyltransferase domain-containing protein [Elusimicrobiota bacterium]